MNVYLYDKAKNAMINGGCEFINFWQDISPLDRITIQNTSKRLICEVLPIPCRAPMPEINIGCGRSDALVSLGENTEWYYVKMMLNGSKIDEYVLKHYVITQQCYNNIMLLYSIYCSHVHIINQFPAEQLNYVKLHGCKFDDIKYKPFPCRFIMERMICTVIYEILCALFLKPLIAGVCGTFGLCVLLLLSYLAYKNKCEKLMSVIGFTYKSQAPTEIIEKLQHDINIIAKVCNNSNPTIREHFYTILCDLNEKLASINNTQKTVIVDYLRI